METFPDGKGDRHMPYITLPCEHPLHEGVPDSKLALPDESPSNYVEAM